LKQKHWSEQLNAKVTLIENNAKSAAKARAILETEYGPQETIRQIESFLENKEVLVGTREEF